MKESFLERGGAKFLSGSHESQEFPQSRNACGVADVGASNEKRHEEFAWSRSAVLAPVLAAERNSRFRNDDGIGVSGSLKVMGQIRDEIRIEERVRRLVQRIGALRNE